MHSTTLHGFTIYYEQIEEFRQLKREIFTQHSYYFETDVAAPVIIDAGAHIGLSTLYFARLFPQATILSIEPNPAVLPLLELNLRANALSAQLLPVALAPETRETSDFYADSSPDQWHSTAGFVPGAWTGTQASSEPITVPSITLTSLIENLDRPVDLLKLDIEGAEQSVIAATSPTLLQQIKRAIIEFHPHAGQNCAQFVQLLQGVGFKLRFWHEQQEVSNPEIFVKKRKLILIEAYR